MATTVNELITKVRISGADQYAAQMSRMAAAQKRLVDRSFQVGLGYSKWALIGLTGAVTGLAYSSVRAATEFDGLVRGLQAVMGSAEATREELKRIEEIAKLPGLGYLEAIQGVTSLMSAGFTAPGAERAMMAFGNALATVGRGKEDMKLVLLALTQIATKARVSGEEIRQLAERLPTIRRMMVSAFGTADTEELANMGVTPEQFLTKLIPEFEKMAKVTGGARNAFENFSDAFLRFRIAIGQGFLQVLMPILQRLETVFQTLATSGAIERLMNQLLRMVNVKVIADGLQRAVLGVIAGLVSLPQYIALVGRWFQDHFGLIRNLVASVAAILAVMFVGSVISGIANFIRAVVLLGGAMARIVAQLVAVNVLSRQWITAMAGVVAGIAAFAVFAGGLGEIRGALGGLANVLNLGPMTRNYRQLLDLFGGGGPTATGELTRALGDRASAIINPLPGGSSAVAEIAKNTRETAENTKPLDALNRRMLGGGDLGQIGVTPVEIAGFSTRRSGGVTVNIYGGDPGEIERTILNLRRRGLV